jgi:hypothetical protein
MQAGTKSNVIPDHAVLQLNVRTFSDSVRNTVLEAIRRIVRAECDASGCPHEPEFQLFDRFPLTDNDTTTTDRVTAAFGAFFGERATPVGQQSASEDFSDIPSALGIPYTYWFIGGIDREVYDAAAAAGRIAQDIPVNHSARFAPVIQPTLDHPQGDDAHDVQPGHSQRGQRTVDGEGERARQIQSQQHRRLGHHPAVLPGLLIAAVHGCTASRSRSHASREAPRSASAGWLSPAARSPARPGNRRLPVRREHLHGLTMDAGR